MTGLSQEQTLQAQSSSQAIVRRLKAWLPKRWYAHAILLFAVVAMGFPMFYAIIVSTQTNADVFNYRFTPGNDLARNWDVVVNQRNLFQFMLNSVFVALVMTTGKAVLSLLAGLAFVFFRFPFKCSSRLFRFSLHKSENFHHICITSKNIMIIYISF